MSALVTCPAWCTSAHASEHEEPGDHLRQVVLNGLDGVDLVPAREPEEAPGVVVSVWVGGNEAYRLGVDEGPARLRALSTMLTTAADEIERLDRSQMARS